MTQPVIHLQSLTAVKNFTDCGKHVQNRDGGWFGHAAPPRIAPLAVTRNLDAVSCAACMQSASFKIGLLVPVILGRIRAAIGEPQ